MPPLVTVWQAPEVLSHDTTFQVFRSASLTCSVPKIVFPSGDHRGLINGSSEGCFHAALELSNDRHARVRHGKTTRSSRHLYSWSRGIRSVVNNGTVGRIQFNPRIPRPWSGFGGTSAEHRDSPKRILWEDLAEEQRVPLCRPARQDIPLSFPGCYLTEIVSVHAERPQVSPRVDLMEERDPVTLR